MKKSAKKRRDIKDLLDAIDFSPENVITAAAENSVLFVEAIDHRKDSLTSRTEAKLAMEELRARTDLRLRHDAAANGDRVTEKQLDSLVLTDERVIEAMRKYNRADSLDEYMKLVVEAFRMRRDCLQIISGLVRNELSVQSALEAGAEKLSSARKKLRERFPED